MLRHSSTRSLSLERDVFSLPSSGIFIFGVIALSTVLKLFFSYNVYGTDDITRWQHFSDLIRDYGTFEIYRLERMYNHPPLMSWVLKGIAWIASGTGLSFGFVFRLLPIFADSVALWVVWRLVKLHKIRNKELILIFCAFNPINFFVSAFHGNTDPVFIALVLLSIYLCEIKKTGFAGLVYGLSLCVKIVPILLMPAFIVWLDSDKKKIIFFSTAAIFPALIFLPYLLHDFSLVFHNIFEYAGLRGQWGLGHISRSGILDENLPAFVQNISKIAFTWHLALGTFIYFIAAIATCYFLKGKKVTLTFTALICLCLFLIVTPGFGVQYLSWLPFFAVMAAPLIGAFYSILGGYFLYRVYVFWSGGSSLYYANSGKVGPWIGADKLLELALWGMVILIFAQALRKLKPKGPDVSL